MAVNNLTATQLEFIFDNEGKMKQKEIASCLGVTPACVCKVLKKSKVVNGYFDIEEFKKYYVA